MIRKPAFNHKQGYSTFICVTFIIAVVTVFSAALPAQNSHPHLFFDRAGMDALQQRVLTNPRLNKIWQQFKIERADSAMRIEVADAGFDSVQIGRSYGDALGDLTVAYIVLRDRSYVDKAAEIIGALAARASWQNRLVTAHISMGMAFCWDVMYDEFTGQQRQAVLTAISNNANNSTFPDEYANANWTAAAGEGLVGLAFKNDGDASFRNFVSGLLDASKWNFKEKARNVLWAHGTDGFPHEGLGYWRKYTHIGLFFKALRRAEPENDWFHLGSDYPGSEFLKNTAYSRIYADVQHAEIAALTWSDATQVRGKYGNLATLSLLASEYRDGYVLDFIDYLVNEAQFDFNGEDWATFVFYDDEDIPARSYRDLPLSRYWPDMEAAIFRSGWHKEDMIFYMKCGSPGGHGRRIKGLPEGGHDHPDANGFVLFFNNDYLAAEDAWHPTIGPDAGSGKQFTSGHNTLLVDGEGQRGDGTRDVTNTNANMDYLDAGHMGYLLGDASDAYANVNRFYRHVLFKKHKYFVIIDELQDVASHKYEFLLGTDDKHRVQAVSESRFDVTPTTGNATLLVDFVEPRQIASEISQDRIYNVTREYVDMLHVWPEQNNSEAVFFSLHYPLRTSEVTPGYSKSYTDGRSVLVVDGTETYIYNSASSSYTHEGVTTDARICYFNGDAPGSEFLLAGGREFHFQDGTGLSSSKTLVATFADNAGKIRLGKNLGESGPALIRLSYPAIREVLIDGEAISPTTSGSGFIEFALEPKQFKIGPSGWQQTVTDNYDVFILHDSDTSLVELQQPNGGEQWDAGSIQTIRWTAASFISNVAIEFSSNNGLNWQAIVTNIVNTGSFDWTTPNLESDHCLIRISDADRSGITDISDSVFSLSLPAIVPQILSFTPTTGPVGTDVTIFGEGFAGIYEVSFSYMPASVIAVDSNTRMRARVPPNATSGQIMIRNQAAIAWSSDVFVVTVVPQPTTLSFTPVDDAYVRSSHPTENKGVSLDLRVRQASSYDVMSYLKFEVTGVTDDIKSAKLQLRVYDGSDAGGAIFSASNKFAQTGEEWRESALTWANAPEVNTASALDTAGAVIEGDIVEFDVTNGISGNGLFSFVITSTSDDMARYRSRESSEPPVLLVELSGADPLPLPGIVSFDPKEGTSGQKVTIIGTGFDETIEASFAGVPTSFSIVSNTEIRAKVPAAARTGRIAVRTSVGMATSQQDFVVRPDPPEKPVISSFSPNNDVAGAEVSIKGENLRNLTKVEFNHVSAVFTELSPQLVIATIPQRATTGRIRVSSLTGVTESNTDFVVDTTVSAIELAALASEIPETVLLKPNYPNPFNTETTILYGIPEASHVRLQIFDVRGRFVRLLVDELQTAGMKHVTWDGRDARSLGVSTGVYLSILTAGKTKLSRKLILQK